MRRHASRSRGARCARATLVVVLLSTGLLAASGTSAVAFAAPSLGASLSDSVNSTQNGAHATVTCDPATNQFTIHVTGVVLNATFVSPSQIYARIGGVGPGATAIGDLVMSSGQVQNYTGLLNGSCVAGNSIEVYGPTSDQPPSSTGLSMIGTLHSLDSTAPVVTTPPNKTVEATGPSGAVVTYPGPLAVDAVDGPRPVSCNQPSGATYPLGTTTITCTASDNSGNVGSASFTIRVVDTTPPSLTVPGNLSFNAPGLNRGAATYDAPFSATAFDTVDRGVGVTCNPHSGSAFPFATTTVTCRATDRAGNTTTRSFKVTVRAPGATDVPLALPTATNGAVTGTIDLAPSRGGPSRVPPVPLDDSVTAFACSTSIHTFRAIRTTAGGGQPAPCVAGGSTDGSHTFTVGALAPGTYSLFGSASSAVGDFTVGPVAVTIAAGKIVTQDLTVAVPRDAAGLVGNVVVDDVPTGTSFAFQHLYACNSITHFTSTGAPPKDHFDDAHGPSCVEGTITPSTPPAHGPISHVTEQDTATYAVGPLTSGTKQIYVVYSNAYGTFVSSPLAVDVSVGEITTAPVLTIRFPKTAANGGVAGTAALKPSHGPALVALADGVTVYACSTSVTTLDRARAVVSHAVHSTATGAPQCTTGGSADSLQYLVAGLTPGTYHFFAAAPSEVGEFVAGPVTVTVAAGTLVVQNFVLNYPARLSGLVGRVAVTNVPTGTNFEFAHVFTCDSVVTFNADGTPPANARTASASGPGSSCNEGTIDPDKLTPSGKTTETATAGYRVGPATDSPTHIYVVFTDALGVFVSRPLSANLPSSGGVETGPSFTFGFPAATVGGVQGRVVVTGSAAGPLGTEGATLTGDVNAYVCSTSVGRYRDIDTGNGRPSANPPPCVSSLRSDNSMTFSVGSLDPGTYHLFADAPSLVGNFIGGPSTFTVVAGKVTTVSDLSLTFERDQGALFGQARVPNVAAGITVQFLHVYACDGRVQFSADGSVPTVLPGHSRGGGPSCVAATLGQPTGTPSSVKGALTFSVLYEVGPLTSSATVHLYVVYRTQFGIVESGPTSVFVTNGRVGTD